MAVAQPTMQEAPARLPTRRWTRAEYYRAAELGLFDLDERLELIEGEIVTMSPKDLMRNSSQLSLGVGAGSS